MGRSRIAIVAVAAMLATSATVAISGGESRIVDAGQVDAARRDGAVNGRLPPEIIQRIVRQHFALFKSCYNEGLRRNPRLQGRTATKFVIDTTGHVSQAAESGSNFPDDAAVPACVARQMMTLEFPSPEGGIVTVVYPLVFSPGGDDSVPAVGAAGIPDASRRD